MALPESLADLRIDTPHEPRQLFADVDKAHTAFLRAESEAAMLSAFAAAGIVPAEGETLPPTFWWPGIGDIAIVGTIYTEAVEDEAGNVVTPPVARPGWHVNVLLAA